MNKTPRTDERVEVINSNHDIPREVVPAKFARELENEIAELKSEVKRLQKLLDWYTSC